MTASKNLSKVELEQRRNVNVTHGYKSAKLRLDRGQPFANVAAEVYQKTLARWGRTDAELDRSGMFGDRIREVVRHQTVSDMCYMLVLSAAAAGDLDEWERWVKLWRSISNRTIGHMNRLQELLDNDQTLDYEQILHSPAEVQPE